MKIPNAGYPGHDIPVSLARIVSEDSQQGNRYGRRKRKSSKDS